MQSLLILCPQCGKDLKLKDRRLLGRRGVCPNCQHKFILQEPEAVQLELDEPPQTFPGIQTHSAPAVPPVAINQPVENPGLNFETTSTSTVGTQRLRELKKRNAKRRNFTLVASTLVIIGVAGVVLAAINWDSLTESKASPSRSGNKFTKTDPKSQKKSGTNSNGPGKRAGPTNGKPITLKLVPSGTRILINIRPAELWNDELQQKEFRACLGPVAVWAAEQIKERCLFEPSEIEELLIGIIPGIPGTPPEVTAVVHLKQKQSPSELITKFQARPNEEWGPTVYVGEGRSYLIHDEKTFAVVPNGMEADLVEAREEGGVTSLGIEEILNKTDRRRHFTLVFEPLDALIHHEVLAPEVAQPFFNQFFDWFGEEVESVAWSIHVGDSFHSELVLRNKTGTGTSPAKLKKLVDEKLEKLAGHLYSAVRKMQPQQIGRQKVVGRFPAMMKVFLLATHSTRADRYVHLSTELPQRAAPNLALGALLTWDESTRTDFNRKAPTNTGKPQVLAQSIVEKLKKKIDIDFRRTPLHEALAYIGKETNVNIEIDGDALKLSGYTKNMPQTYNLGLVPATKALHEIIKEYPDMVLVVEEQRKLMTVMTKAVAKTKNLTTYNPGQ